jgi:hypothetical protein
MTPLMIDPHNDLRVEELETILREWRRTEIDLLDVRLDKERDAVIYECPLCTAYTLSEWPEVIHKADCLITRTEATLGSKA